MLELNIIKSLLQRDSYIKYRRYINIEHNKELQKVYSVLDEMQVSLQRDLTPAEFRMFLEQKDPELVMYADNIDMSLPSDSLEELLLMQSQRQWAYEHALLAMKVAEGREDIEVLQENYNSFSLRKTPENKDLFVTDDIEAILSSTDRSGGLKWRLPSLQTRLGGLIEGDFGFVFARSNTGKTTFLASEFTNFAGQTDRPVVWFNNEQQGHVVKLRLIQSSLGCHDSYIRENKERCIKEYLTRTKGNVKLFDSNLIHKKDVERVIEQTNPSLIVIDQLDKIAGFKSDRLDSLYGAIYNWARMISKNQCITIGVCQAAASAENKKWLTMDDVAEAKTSKQAEADFIIGIGSKFDVGYENIRYINIIKDKVGVEDKKFECRIDINKGRYYELN